MDFMTMLIPIVAIISTFIFVSLAIVVPLYYGYKKRRMMHEERLKAIEKGISLPDLQKEHEEYCCHHKNSLRKGIVLLAVGIGLAIALYLQTESFQTGAAWGLFVAIIGIGHLFYWFVAERKEGNKENP